VLNITSAQEVTGALLRRVDIAGAGHEKLQLIQAYGDGQVVAGTAKMRLPPSSESVSL